MVLVLIIILMYFHRIVNNCPINDLTADDTVLMYPIRIGMTLDMISVSRYGCPVIVNFSMIPDKDDDMPLMVYMYIYVCINNYINKCEIKSIFLS